MRCFSREPGTKPSCKVRQSAAPLRQKRNPAVVCRRLRVLRRRFYLLAHPATPLADLLELRTLSEQVSAHIPLAVGNAKLSDWLSLLKPRVLLLVVYTGVIGVVVAPGHLPP